MAACQIVIKLDDPTRVRTGGESVTGTIIVLVEKATHCKGLIVRSQWSTHGRGNIDSGEVDQRTLFEGEWQAGQEYSYPFSLKSAVWPPTYYGTYVNVGHYVQAQAKLAWKIDPKSQVEYPVAATEAPDDLKPTQTQAKSTNWIGWVIGSIFLIILLAAFSFFLIFLLPLFGIIGGLIWFFKVFLPKQITGPVECQLKTPKVAGGAKVQASMAFTPKRSSTINGIEWTISCIEECSSGSGSNRKTHQHEVLKTTVRASETLELKAGEKQAYDFEFALPEDAAPSLKFSDNHIKWNVTGRIDIPKWPDWTKSLPLLVSPSAAQTQKMSSYFASGGEPPPVVPYRELTAADEAWFSQVLSQIQQTQHDPEKLDLVIQAVRNFSFPLTIAVEDEIDTPYFEDDDEFDRLDEYEWWNASCPKHNIELSIAWPRTPVEVDAGTTWSGNAIIVGYESEEHRIVMEAVS